MTDANIKKIFTNYTYIIIDTREKKMHIKEMFDALGTHYERGKLSYGDYGIKIVPNDILGNTEDIIFKVAVERKNGLDEISNNLAKEKDRFHREMQRAKDEGAEMVIMIEDCTYLDIATHNYSSKLSPKSFMGLLHSITAKYGFQFVFVPKTISSLFVYNYLKYFVRNYLKIKS